MFLYMSLHILIDRIFYKISGRIFRSSRHISVLDLFHMLLRKIFRTFLRMLIHKLIDNLIHKLFGRKFCMFLGSLLYTLIDILIRMFLDKKPDNSFDKLIYKLFGRIFRSCSDSLIRMFLDRKFRKTLGRILSMLILMLCSRRISRLLGQFRFRKIQLIRLVLISLFLSDCYSIFLHLCISSNYNLLRILRPCCSLLSHIDRPMCHNPSRLLRYIRHTRRT